MSGSTQPEKKLPSAQVICLIVALGGLVYGFDIAVISGTLSLVKAQFSLSATSEGWFVSCAMIGCIIGAALTSWLSDRFGRKAVLLGAAGAFLLSAIGCAFSPAFGVLIASRFLGGIGVGMASTTAPMYIAEFAPATSRGKMVACWQLAITIGILLSYGSNAILMNIAHHAAAGSFLQWFFVQEAWRPMFLTMAVPSIGFLLLLLVVPESPKWLFSIGKQEQARTILAGARGAAEADSEIEGMCTAQTPAGEKQRSLTDPALRLPLIIGITLALLQQLCGINAVIYYGPKIFETAGLLSGSALMFQVVVGVINVLFTFIAIATADRWGRKALMLTGLSGMVTALVVCGFLFKLGHADGFLLLGMIGLFVASFALSVGPITLIMIAEIFPTDVRAKAVSLCLFVLWIAVSIVGQFFPWLLEVAGPSLTFWTFAGFSAFNFFFTLFVVKETKNKTLEEVEEMFTKRQ